MRSTLRRSLALVLLLAAGSSTARAQGWDYGRNMFGFVQHTPGGGWSGQYHPGDGRPGIYFVDAGNGNYYGDPRGRPLVVVPGVVAPRTGPPRWPLGRFGRHR